MRTTPEMSLIEVQGSWRVYTSAPRYLQEDINSSVVPAIRASGREGSGRLRAAQQQRHVGAGKLEGSTLGSTSGKVIQAGKGTARAPTASATRLFHR